jgi:Spherulation-specific family 4
MKSVIYGIVGLLSATGVMTAAPLGITVPAYFYPGPLWEQLNQAASQVPLTAIMNPASGPQAPAADITNYNNAVRSLQVAGGRVIGYIFTNYGTRDIAAVKADVDFYVTQYTPLNGFFLDEMNQSPNADDLTYYRKIYDYIKAKNASYQVTANPGSYSGEIYLQAPTATDTLVTFENKEGYDTTAAPAWVLNHLAWRFMHIPWSVATAEQMDTYVRLAKSRNTGQIYITDDDGKIVGSNFTNPWDTLPSYWQQEVQLVKSLNAADLATRLSLTRSQIGLIDLQINGSPGVYEVQVTQDLLQWNTLTTSFTASGLLTLPDPAGGNFTKRFYRAVQ